MNSSETICAFIFNVNHSVMNTKLIMDFGKQVLAVVVGVAVYNAVRPMFDKAKISAPASAMDNA